jgi:hypothetical protein
MRVCALAPQLRQAMPTRDEPACEFLAIEELFAGKMGRFQKQLGGALSGLSAYLICVASAVKQNFDYPVPEPVRAGRRLAVAMPSVASRSRALRRRSAPVL